MAPALIVLASCSTPTKSLVASQSCFPSGIRSRLILLVLLTRRPDVMGAFVNARAIRSSRCRGGVISALNVFLLITTFWG